ncbi:MAG: sulfatase-like hydrolase/transferase [Halobacteriaceae archaeon]
MPPNVLLVLADDLRPGAVGHGGAASTPTIDRLARGGTSVRPYTTAPVCMPGRAELMTGRNAFRNGCRDNGQFPDDGLAMLPGALADRGYHTFLAGMWHELREPEGEFDETRRVLYRDNQNEMARDGHTMRFPDGAEGNADELVADAARDLLADPPTAPWFGLVGFSAPHIPHTPPEPFDGQYDPADVAVPPNFAYDPVVDTGTLTENGELLEDYPRTPRAIRERRADYYGLVSHLDHQVGRVLDAVPPAVREDTLVVFTADHGLAVGSHGLLAKQNLFEHTARVPLVASGPGVAAGRRADPLCGHYDLFPTLFDLLGLDASATVEGESYAPVLRGETGAARDAVFGAYRDTQRMARAGRWKLVRYHDGREQLFDVVADPHETRDLLPDWRGELLAEDPESVEERVAPWRRQRHPDWAYERAADPDEVAAALADLRERLAAWQREMDDPLA